MGNDNDELSYVEKFSVSVVTFMERVFYRHGKFIALHPIYVMCIVPLVCLLASLGFLNIHMESKPEKLWIPQESDFVKTLEWQKTNHPNNHRIEKVLFQADNVLKPEYIKWMHQLKENISALYVLDSSGKNRTQNDMCYRVPALGGDTERRIKNNLFGNEEESKGVDWSLKLQRKVYCQFFDLMPTSCLYLGILDIWPSNINILQSLTQEDIIESINSVNESYAYSFPMNFTNFLGGITRNATGHIIGAKTCIHLWNMELNRTEIKNKESKRFSAGISTEVDENLYKWEGKFIDKVLSESSQVPFGLSVWPQAHRSFVDISEQTIFGDVKYLMIGMCVLFVYVFLVIGKFNMVEIRPVLTGMGIASTYLAVVFSFGICSACGIVYGPIHSILPLLLLGLGVDDMFVIVQSLETLQKHQQGREMMPVEEKMGHVLSHAGVAITLTSLTDFMAFSIGSTTSLPALRSFCIYAAVGIISLYLMQITFFLAIFTMDQRRLEADRNGFIWCVKHRNWEPNQCSQNNYLQMFFDKVYAPWILKRPFKIAVLLVTAIFTSFCIWGVTNLRQEFKIIWFLPKTSYVSQFMTKMMHYYPGIGNSGIVYIDQIDLPGELENVRWLTESMENSEWIASIDSWYDPLVQYTLRDTGVNLQNDNISSNFFSMALNKFLFSPSGASFQSFFYFNDSLKCLGEAPTILGSKFSYQHKVIDDRDDQIKAMVETKNLVKKANFSGFSACISLNYNDWETNKLIVSEVIKNLSLAMVAVFIMTSLLLVNIRASFFVLLCVILTLTDVMALMCWWGLTIDTVTCINLVLCVGLSVDYSAHVALHFMKVRGSRNERALRTLSEIGPPVFNGAFSTFLAFVFLANSDSHVFMSFFKIFFGVFVYGVFHGLVFLPVALSIVGPPPYRKELNREAIEQGPTHSEGTTVRMYNVPFLRTESV